MNRSCNPAPKGLHHRPMSAARVSITPGLPRTFLRFPGITDSRWAGYSHLRQARRSACLEPMGQARRSKEGRNPNPSKKGNPMRSPCRQEWRTLPAPPRALSSGWRLLACMAAVAGASSAQPAGFAERLLFLLREPVPDAIHRFAEIFERGLRQAVLHSIQILERFVVLAFFGQRLGVFGGFTRAAFLLHVVLAFPQRDQQIVQFRQGPDDGDGLLDFHDRFGEVSGDA